jgi:hypothetical protein
MEREITDDDLNAVVGGRINLPHLHHRPHNLPPGSISAGPSAPSYVAAGVGIGAVLEAIGVGTVLAFL